MINLFYRTPKSFAFGPRLYVRPPCKKDKNKWLAARYRSYEFLQPWEPTWHQDAITSKGFYNWLEFAVHGNKTMTDIPLLLFDKSNNALLGGLTLKDIKWGAARNTSLGYWMNVDYAGKGYMAEAIACIGIFCFDNLKLNRIEAACVTRNNRSSSLLKKLSFAHEGSLRQLYFINGVWENHELYAMLAKDKHHLITYIENI